MMPKCSSQIIPCLLLRDLNGSKNYLINLRCWYYRLKIKTRLAWWKFITYSSHQGNSNPFNRPAISPNLSCCRLIFWKPVDVSISSIPHSSHAFFWFLSSTALLQFGAWRSLWLISVTNCSVDGKVFSCSSVFPSLLLDVSWYSLMYLKESSKWCKFQPYSLAFSFDLAFTLPWHQGLLRMEHPEMTHL